MGGGIGFVACFELVVGGALEVEGTVVGRGGREGEGGVALGWWGWGHGGEGGGAGVHVWWEEGDVGVEAGGVEEELD